MSFYRSLEHLYNNTDNILVAISLYENRSDGEAEGRPGVRKRRHGQPPLLEAGRSRRPGERLRVYETTHLFLMLRTKKLY